MNNGIDFLLDILNSYKNIELNNGNDKKIVKEIDKILEIIENRRYITDLNVIETLAKKFESNDIDNVLNKLMLNIKKKFHRI